MLPFDDSPAPDPIIRNRKQWFLRRKKTHLACHSDIHLQAIIPMSFPYHTFVFCLGRAQCLPRIPLILIVHQSLPPLLSTLLPSSACLDESRYASFSPFASHLVLMLVGSFARWYTYLAGLLPRVEEEGEEEGEEAVVVGQNAPTATNLLHRTLGRVPPLVPE